MKKDPNSLIDDIDYIIEEDKLLMDEQAKINLADVEELLQQEELNEPCDLSPEFEARMERLFLMSDIEMQRIKERKKRFPRIVAVIALCTIMFTGIFVGIQTEAIPLPKFSYLVKKDDSSYKYLLEQEKFVKDSLEEKYMITYIPKEYKLLEMPSDSKLFLSGIYTDMQSKNLIFHQCSNQMIERVDEIIKDYKEMVFDGSKYYVLDRKNYNKILWYADGYQYTVQANLQTDELVRIAQSIEKQ